MLRPHIVILGAGFGGTYVAKKLVPLVQKGEIDLTIVNRTNYFLFTPLLHEVATGALSPRSVAEPLREVFAHSGVGIIQGSVDAIDASGQTVKVRENGRDHMIEYDYLVIATGAETNYYGIPGAAELALPLKSLSDAAAVRNRVIDMFEQAVLTVDPTERKKLLAFAVVGGGATGVELAAELCEFIAGIVARYYDKTRCQLGDGQPCGPEEPSVTLIHGGKELLEPFKPTLRRAAASRLVDKGVIVRTEASVTSVTRAGLVLKTGETISASTIIWTAGVKAILPHFEGTAPTVSGGRLSVDGMFRVLGADKVFALGDVSAYVEPRAFAKDSANAKPLPMLAQVASAEAKTVASNIVASIRGKKLHDFSFHSKGSMVSVGRWFAIGEVLSRDISGRLTWWMWRTVYIFKFASWRKRIRIGFEWAFELISPRDITKI